MFNAFKLGVLSGVMKKISYALNVFNFGSIGVNRYISSHEFYCPDALGYIEKFKPVHLNQIVLSASKSDCAELHKLKRTGK